MLTYLLCILITMVTASTNVTAGLCFCYHQCCGNYCGKVLMCVLLLLIFVCSASNLDNTQDKRLCWKGTILPREPYFLEGQDIVLICSRKKGSYKGLTFVRGQNSEVLTNYTEKLNKTAIKLVIPHVTSDDIDEIDYSTQYKCVKKKNITKCYDSVNVRLEYAVRKPVNLKCRDFDFDQMTCNWSLGVEYHSISNVIVTCEYRNASAHEMSVQFKTSDADWKSCPNLTNFSCHWDVASYPATSKDIDIRVIVRNTIKNDTKVISQTFFKYDIVEPGPVTHLQHQNTLQNRCVELKWKPASPNRSFVFLVTYNSSCSSQQEKRFFYFADEESFNETVTLCDLVPYTLYSFTVKGRLLRQEDDGKYHERGYWSKSAEIEIQTESDVIDVNPVIESGLYELFNNTDRTTGGNSSIRLYWTPLEECDFHDNPDLVNYVLKTGHATQSVNYEAFKAVMNIPWPRTFNISLHATNSIGALTTSSIVTVYQKTRLRPSELIIQYNRTNNLGCETYATIVSREKEFFPDLHHTVVWCRGTHECEEQIAWKTNATSSLLLGNMCDSDYRYGIVTHGYDKVQGQTVNTGIHWEPCIYQLGKEIDKPLENIQVWESKEGGGFTVEWERYDCKETKVYITDYQVSYCETEDENCSCKDKQHKNVSIYHDSYTWSDVPAGSKICVWVRGISYTSMGPANEKPEMLTIGKQDKSMVIAGVVSGVFAFLVLAVVIYISRKRLKKIKDESKNITVPVWPDHLPVDQYQSLMGNGMPTTGTWLESEPNHNSSACTVTTNLLNTSEDQWHQYDSSDMIEGYKNSDEVEATESGFNDGTISGNNFDNSLEMRSDNVRESQKKVDEQNQFDPECIRTIEVDKNDKCMSENDINGSNLSENFEMQAVSVKSKNHFSSENTSLVQESEEETDFITLIDDQKENPIYTDMNSGETLTDDSDVDDSDETNNAVETSLKINDIDKDTFHQHKLSETACVNVNVDHGTEEKSDEDSHSGQTFVILDSAIKDKETSTDDVDETHPQEFMAVLNDCLNDISVSVVNEDQGDFPDLFEIIDESDEDIDGYQIPNDVSEISGNIREMRAQNSDYKESENETDGYKLAKEVEMADDHKLPEDVEMADDYKLPKDVEMAVDMSMNIEAAAAAEAAKVINTDEEVREENESSGYKLPQDVKTWSTEDVSSGGVLNEITKQNERSELVESFDKNDTNSEKPAEKDNEVIRLNGIKNGIIPHISDALKRASSEIEITSPQDSFGTSSSSNCVISYVKVKENLSLTEEASENQDINSQKHTKSPYKNGKISTADFEVLT